MGGGTAPGGFAIEPTLHDDLSDVLNMLEQLTDVTFLLYHQVTKGYRTEQQERVVKMVLEDSIELLRDHGYAFNACTKCGSTDTKTSNYHAANCGKDQ